MEDLLQLRQEIDEIDQEMVRLFEKRMDVSRRVAEYKIANGKKILDRGREVQKLESLGELAHSDFNRHGVQELFQQIMAMSRKLQYQLLEQEGVSGSLPFTRIEKIDRKHCRVVYQGVEGAYQHEAAIQYFGEGVNIFHMSTWRECMEAIKEGMADYAVLTEGERLIYATHGHVYNTAHLPPLQPGDILLHGHTHIPAWEVFGTDNLYLNPGSVSIPKAGTPHSYMTLENGVFTWKKLGGDVYHTLTL